MYMVVHSGWEQECTELNILLMRASQRMADNHARSRYQEQIAPVCLIPKHLA